MFWQALIALATAEIVLGEFFVLGPIDPQIVRLRAASIVRARASKLVEHVFGYQCRKALGMLSPEPLGLRPASSSSASGWSSFVGQNTHRSSAATALAEGYVPAVGPRSGLRLCHPAW
jgi:hypothetical protein